MPRAKAAAAAGKKPRAPKNTHQLAEPLPPGEVLIDQLKKPWCLGKAVGSGGFGLIYLASSGERKGSEDYVIKVEPHANGPLFCELNFYQRVAKPEYIAEWLARKKKKIVGMPKYIAFGSYERKGVRYRFMVMERFGTDLQKLFENNGKEFSRKTVLQLGLSLVDCLEYIHDKGYAHADIKASNLLLGYAKGTQNQVYLVDYGLAYRFNIDGNHKEYKEDPRKAHDGTIEFTSRDAHKGVTPSCRGDLEILGYCLVQWLCKQLPWEDNLDNKDYVRDQKIKHMKNIPTFLKTCFPRQTPPAELNEYLKYVVDLDYDERPDYNYVRSIFTKALKKNGFAADGKLDFAITAASPKKKSAAKGRKRISEPVESSDEEEPSVHKAARRGAPGKCAGNAIIPGAKGGRKRAVEPVESSDEERSPPKVARRGQPAKCAGNAIIPGAKGGRRRVSEPMESNEEEEPTAGRGLPVKCAGNGIIPAVWRPKGGGATGRASPAGKANGVKGRRSPATKAGKVTKAKDRRGHLKQAADAATQTSPGLKGLPRSWKKTQK